MSEEKSYISYFQSVTTIGIMTNGVSDQDAAKKAREKLLSKDGINYCHFDQTDFELSEVETWIPELDSVVSGGGVAFKFNPDEKTKNIIAERLHKNVSEITDSDYHEFVRDAIQKGLMP